MPRPAPRVLLARPTFRLLALLSVLAIVTGPVAAAPGQRPNRSVEAARLTAPAPISSGLLTQLETGETDRFIVEFSAEADLAPAPAVAGFRARGSFVVNALTATADAAQADAIALVASTPGARAESYWLRNTLIVSGSATLAEQLAALPGVATVRAERVFPLVKPVEMDLTIAIEGAEPEWGVAKIGADAVWDQGILGSGIVVANIDTGVDYEHPALVEQYRGNLGDGSFDHNFSWWDPTGICGDVPCDNAQHGTHTMGTMVGGDGPGPFTPDVGVAPGARWIAAKGCEDFGCTEGSLLSSGQFMLAPTDLAGDNPDPARRPDIINNSWGGGPGDPFYTEVVTAWRAAGIVPVFASGNDGPGCGSGGAPGDMDGAFSAGATDIDDVIADFSGRGPSQAGKINPNVSAPGVDVVSTIPGGGYASFSGTSMAAPHTAGTLALIMSAEPGLIGQVEGSTAAVRDTALDIIDEQCGGAEDGDPNNVYGDGRIDALAAVALVATGGTLAGTITDAVTGDSIGGAQVAAANGARTFTATTAEDGTYDLFLAAGTYAVTASAFGYEQALAESVEIVTDQTTTQDFGLTPLPRFDVTGVVTASADGAPIAGARVVAIGTPVPPAVTDANGFYTLTLPQGSYTLRASAGGCTELGFADIVLDSDITQDFEIARKLDDFGHGCAPIAFDWVDATTQTALFGDEFAGRLRLPFDFSFYGETYSQIFISDNGYLNFLGPDQFNGFPIEIPSESPPNAAIYALWQEMSVGESAAIEYDTVGDAPNRAFVIEYADVSGNTFEIKLWENGDVDLLYADAGDGANAGIGIENAAGDDALQFSYLTDLLTPNDAYRYSVVPTGLVTGTVTDANDGLPIAGATVEAVDAGRSTTTAEDGTYQLRLLPGDYTIRISADGYTTFEGEISLAVDEVLVVDAALAAPIGSVEPTEITASVELGSSTDAIVTLSNSGSGPLEWEVRERPTGETPPELPAIAGSPTREPSWSRPSVPAGLPQARTSTIPPELLNEIIDDPAGDAVGSIDVDTVRAGADAAEITMQIELTADSPIDEAAGFVFLDTDQDPTTGLPADAFSGLPTQDVGLEYFVDLFGIHEPEPVVLIVDAFTFEIVATTAARLEGQSIGFDVPLAAIGGDDGFVNTAMVLGDFFQPTDWAPDEGHGTIEPFTDAPWVSESPESGSVPAGASTEITVTLGGPDVAAGTYTGLLVFITNDPKNGPFVVDLTLTVTLPESFGSVSGTVTDAHSGEPLPAEISIAAEVDGQPYPLETTAGPDGTYRVFGPEGTWPATFSLDGYVPQTLDVTIVRGIDTPGVDVALHREQPHAVLEGGPLEFVLPPDATADETLVLSNPEGHSELTFEVGEVSLDAGPGLAPETAGRPLPAGADPNSVTTRGLGLDDAVPDARSITVVGDVLTSWPTGLDLAWGVGFTGNVWLSDVLEAGDACGASDACTNHEFDTAGTPTGAVIEAPWVDAFHADMAYDPGRNWLWQVHVGGENGIYGLDVTDGSVEQVLTGSPWSDISQRGVAYDPGSDTFYVGGWNEGVIYHVAGPSWPTPGETLASCAPADPAISGLAWNPAFSLLWVATNSDADTIYLVDPVTCETLQALAHPEPGFSGAGIEIDTTGNLWTVSQASGSAFLIESGLPNFSDAPWLSVTPEAGSVPVDGSVDLTVSVDTAGLAPGAYRAQVVILTNDPDNSSLVVPVLLVVPEYQRGVNAGGPAYTAVGGTAYAADRAYRTGSYGYVGSGAVKSTRAAIAGTDDDPLYQRMRQNMAAYRFDVPVEGIYRVDLAFAEIVARRAGARVFSVIIEGQSVISNLDVYAEVGGNTALGRSLDVLVTDGTLDVEFFTHRGDRAFVSSLLVTHRPDMAAE